MNLLNTNIPSPRPAYSVGIQEVPYLSVGGRTLRARVYRPQADGIFPAIVCVHGGAWVSGDRTSTQGFADLFAACGFVVFAIDFRMAPRDPYPSSLLDINHAIRWVKAHALDFSVDSAAVGGLGISSGGHLILLSALRPFDPRYASVPLENGADFDARLGFVVTCSGVLDPFDRYRMAQKIGDRDIIACHDAYFGSEETMREASPPLILARGEAVDLPPALFFQGATDERVPAGTAERTARLYRHAGAQAAAVIYPDMGHAVGTWGPREISDVLARTAVLAADCLK